METPTILLNIESDSHKIKYNRSYYISYDTLDVNVDVPIVCDGCKKKILFHDDLISFDTQEREMGNEMLLHNINDEIDCPKCGLSLTVKVEISLYAYNFEFYEYELENCVFSNVLDLKKLDEYIPVKKKK